MILKMMLDFDDFKDDAGILKVLMMMLGIDDFEAGAGS